MLGLTAGNVITIITAIGAVLASYVADHEVLATLRAENAYLREQTQANTTRITALEIRNEQGEQRLGDKIDALRESLIQHNRISNPTLRP